MAPVQEAVAVAVGKAGDALSLVTRVARLRARVRWFHFKMLELGDGTFAFVRCDNELERYPDRGGYSVEDAEKFVRARENEPVF